MEIYFNSHKTSTILLGLNRTFIKKISSIFKNFHLEFTLTYTSSDHLLINITYQTSQIIKIKLCKLQKYQNPRQKKKNLPNIRNRSPNKNRPSKNTIKPKTSSISSINKKLRSMLKLPSKHSPKPSLVSSRLLPATKAPLTPSTMPTEALHLWPSVTIKKPCMISVRPSGLMISSLSTTPTEETA